MGFAPVGSGLHACLTCKLINCTCDTLKVNKRNRQLLQEEHLEVSRYSQTSSKRRRKSKYARRGKRRDAEEMKEHFKMQEKVPDTPSVMKPVKKSGQSSMESQPSKESSRSGSFEKEHLPRIDLKPVSPELSLATNLSLYVSLCIWINFWLRYLVTSQIMHV